MADCVICGKEIMLRDEVISKETEVGAVAAHRLCVVRLRAVLEPSSGIHIDTQIEQPTPYFMDKIKDDWILNRRGIPVSMMILSYLHVQPEPCDVKSVYEWLRRNEVHSSNPAEYVKKLRNRGLISVLKSDKLRLVQITEAGKKELALFADDLAEREKNPRE